MPAISRRGEDSSAAWARKVPAVKQLRPTDLCEPRRSAHQAPSIATLSVTVERRLRPGPRSVLPSSGRSSPLEGEQYAAIESRDVAKWDLDLIPMTPATAKTAIVWHQS